MKKMAHALLLFIFSFALSSICVAATPAGKKIREPVPLELAAKNSRRSYGWSSNFELSRDGRFIAYAQATDEVVQNQQNPAAYSATGVPRMYGGRTEVSIANTDTGHISRISDVKSWGWAPVWAPNSENLAFYSDEGGAAGLWIWNNGSATTERFPDLIVRPYQSTEAAQWAPDGSYILCKILPKGMTIAEANALSPAQPSAQNPQPKSPFPTVGPNEPSFIVLLSGQPDKKEVKAKETRRSEEMGSAVADLALLDLKTRSVTRIVERTQVRWYAFSPDGKSVAYSIFKDRDAETYQSSYDLLSYEQSTGKSKLLGENLRLSYNGDGCAWSPDSARLACNVAGVQPDKETPAKNEIIVVSAIDGSQRQIATSLQSMSGNTRAPLWDKGGIDIYVIGTDQKPEKTKDWYSKKRDRLWRVNTQSGASAVLIEIPDSQVTDVINPGNGLASESSSILISASKRGDRGGQGGSVLYTVDVKTGNAQPVLELNSRWYGSRQTSIAAGKIAYFSSDLQNPGDVWVFDIKRKRKHQVTRSNEEWDRYELGSGRLLDYRGVDGQELHGALLLPPGYQKGQRVPLVVFAFGHPNDSNYINQFGFFGSTPSYNMHVLATRGFAVLQPDMPLRTGMQMKDMVGTVIPGVNEAIEQGYVDPERMAVIGYSIGSYTAFGLVLQSRRFKAAAIGGISVFPDLFAAYLLGDPRLDSAPEYEGEQGNAGMGGTPWNQRDRYLNNSTAFFFDQLETPLLMGQGTNDGLTVSNAIFKGLRRLNKKVEYRVYEDEDHSISRQPNVIDFWKRRLEFIDENLGICRDSKGRMIFDGQFVRACHQTKEERGDALKK